VCNNRGVTLHTMLLHSCDPPVDHQGRSFSFILTRALTTVNSYHAPGAYNVASGSSWQPDRHPILGSCPEGACLTLDTRQLHRIHEQVCDKSHCNFNLPYITKCNQWHRWPHSKTVYERSPPTCTPHVLTHPGACSFFRNIDTRGSTQWYA
jgi:hypothetical protein